MEDVADRRARLVRRQLAATSTVEAARSVVVLHATDPAAVEEAVQTLTVRLGGTVVVPTFRTPLERRLSGSTAAPPAGD